MKRINVSILAAAIMAAGVVAAVAQSAPYYDKYGMDYLLNAQFTNNPPLVVSAAGLPTLTLTDLEPTFQGAIGTDGAGNIDGVQYARLYFEGGSNHNNNYATFVIDVTGSIRTKGTNPVVKMTLKGHGYDVDGTQNDHPDASLALTFTSTNGPTTVFPSQPVVVNSANYVVTYLDGSTAVFANGPATFINTNSYFMIGGTLTGTAKPGKKSPVNGGKTLKINEAALLITESWIWTVVNGTNVVQQNVGGSLMVNVLSNITAQVVQPYPGTKLYLAGGVGSTLDPCSGTGTVNYTKATYKITLKGVSSAGGEALNVSGTLGALITGYQQTTNPQFPTGYITNYLQNAIQGISFSGKAVGQTIPLTSGFNLGVPFPSVP
jgi:hypothetical protein